MVGGTSIFSRVPHIHFIFLDGGSTTLCQLEPMLVCLRLWQGASAIQLVILIESHHVKLDGSARTHQLEPSALLISLAPAAGKICNIW